MDNYYSMCVSNDSDGLDLKDLFSLGVVNFAGCVWTWAFDASKPLTRMLPGFFPHELHLLIPDLGIAPEWVP